MNFSAGGFTPHSSQAIFLLHTDTTHCLDLGHFKLEICSEKVEPDKGKDMLINLTVFVPNVTNHIQLGNNSEILKQFYNSSLESSSPFSGVSAIFFSASFLVISNMSMTNLMKHSANKTFHT